MLRAKCFEIMIYVKRNFNCGHENLFSIYCFDFFGTLVVVSMAIIIMMTQMNPMLDRLSQGLVD